MKARMSSLADGLYMYMYVYDACENVLLAFCMEGGIWN